MVSALAGSEESGVGADEARVQNTLNGASAFKARQASCAAEERVLALEVVADEGGLERCLQGARSSTRRSGHGTRESVLPIECSRVRFRVDDACSCSDCCSREGPCEHKVKVFMYD